MEASTETKLKPVATQNGSEPGRRFGRPRKPGTLENPPGTLLRQRRQDRGIRANWVAQRMGISGSYLALLEANKRRWNLDLVRGFLKAVGVQKPTTNS